MAEIAQNIITELIKRNTDREETPQAYAAFLFWAGLPTAERPFSESLQKVIEFSGLSESTLREYRVKFQWDERVNLIDAHLFQLSFLRRNELSAEGDKKFVESNRKFQENVIKVSERGLAVVETLLEKANIAGQLKETDNVRVWTADGSVKYLPRTTQIIMDTRLSDVAPLLRSTVDALLKVSGLPTEIVDHRVSKGLGDKPVTDLSDDEITASRQQIATKKAQIIEKGIIG